MEFWRQNHDNLMMDWMWHERDQSGLTLNLSESMKLPFISAYTHRKGREGGCVCAHLRGIQF